MDKAYVVTFTTFLMFLLLTAMVSNYSSWNQKVEADAAKVKGLDKLPFIFDDIGFSMKRIMQVDMNFTSVPGTMTVTFEDFIPATGSITNSLNEYETLIEGDYADNANVDIILNQTSLLASPRIEFSNGLVYEYTDTNKNGVFFYGGGPYMSEIEIRIRANREWNSTNDTNWTWNASGETLVTLDIQDSRGDTLSVGGATQGRVSAYTNNTVSFFFQKEGNQYPELELEAGRVDNQNGSVRIRRMKLVDFESDLTVKVGNYGQVRATLPVGVQVSDGVVTMAGLVVLDEV